MQKIKCKIVLVFLIAILNNQTPMAQTGVPFLADQQSPLLLGAGSIGAAIPNNDVLGSYYNPANLGYMSRYTNFGVLFAPANTKNMRYANNEQNRFALMCGYNFSNSGKGVPISVGMGYSKFSNFGPRNIDECYNNDFHHNNSSQTYSIGIGFNYYINVNVGVSYKKFDSKIIVYGGWESATRIQASGSALDLGTLITVPITKLIGRDYSFNLGEYKLSPDIDLSLGYSQLNIGDEFYYIDYAQADPIPRTARTGYSFNIGFDAEINSAKVRVIDYSFTAEASNILLESIDPSDTLWDHSINYQSFFGDINFWDNVIMLNPDRNVIVHKGHIITLLESLTFTFGSYSGRNEPKHTSYGFGFSTKGILKLLSNSIKNDILAFLTNHLIVEIYTAIVKSIYWYPRNNSSSEHKTNYRSISFALTNIEI